MQPLIFRGGPKNVFPSLEANLIFDLVVESNIFYGLHKKQTPESSDVYMQNIPDFKSNRSYNLTFYFFSMPEIFVFIQKLKYLHANTHISSMHIEDPITLIYDSRWKKYLPG